MNFCKLLLSKLTKIDRDSQFEGIIGYDHIKRLFKLALGSDLAVHIPLVGPPACAKTMFLTSLIRLKNCYFTEGTNSTNAGMIDYILKNRPRFLLIDEIGNGAGHGSGSGSSTGGSGTGSGGGGTIDGSAGGGGFGTGGNTFAPSGCGSGGSTVSGINGGCS